MPHSIIVSLFSGDNMFKINEGIDTNKTSAQRVPYFQIHLQLIRIFNWKGKTCNRMHPLFMWNIRMSWISFCFTSSKRKIHTVLASQRSSGKLAAFCCLSTYISKLSLGLRVCGNCHFATNLMFYKMYTGFKHCTFYLRHQSQAEEEITPCRFGNILKT